jgi:hypothetical protein
VVVFPFAFHIAVQQPFKPLWSRLLLYELEPSRSSFVLCFKPLQTTALPASVLVFLLIWRLPFDLSSKGGPVSSYTTAGIALRVTGILKPPHHDKVDPPMRRLCIIEKKKLFSPSQDSNSRSSGPQLGHSSNYTILAQYCNLSKSLLTLSKVLEKQWVPQLFKKLPAVYVTYPCFAIIQKYKFRKNYVTLPIHTMMMLSFLDKYVRNIFLQYTSQTSLCFLNFNFTCKNCKFAHL